MDIWEVSVFPLSWGRQPAAGNQVAPVQRGDSPQGRRREWAWESPFRDGGRPRTGTAKTPRPVPKVENRQFPIQSLGLEREGQGSEWAPSCWLGGRWYALG